MKMEKLPDLMDEAKDRTIVYLFLIAALAYILSLTSNSVWFNIPVSILIISILRHFHLEFKLQWRMVPIHQESYHSHLKIRRPSHSDPILSSPSISKKWKRKIDSPVVAAAVHKFTLKIVQEFITDLWYSSLTPDQEFPDKICLLINDVLGEVAQRLKHINLIELLTRDVVNLIGSHIELYRRNQAYIGVDVMANLSPNERDERLKHFLASSRELHPALISADTECKVLQQLMGGVVAVVLRPHDAKCPIARSLARELLACVVMQPIMDFASPIFINELIEFLILSAKEEAPNKKTDTDESEELSKGKKISKQHQLNQLKDMPNCGIDLMDPSSIVYLKDINAAQTNNYPKKGLGSSQNDGLLVSQIEVLHDPKSQSGDLEKSMEAKKRTQILASENLDNLWAQGWNYELKDSRKGQYSSGSLVRSPVSQKDSKCVLKKDKAVKENDSIEQGNTERATATNTVYTEGDAKCTDRGKQGPISGTMQSSNQREHQGVNPSKRILLTNTTSALDSGSEKKEESRFPETQILKVQHRRSKSTGTESEQRQNFNILQLSKDGESSLPENTQGLRRGELHDSFHRDNQSATLWRPIGNIFVRKLDCWVLGVHFEKVGMKSIAVYSIAVTNSENKTWFVDRRYRNFEQLHRRLRVIPNYKLQIPPKSFISSNLDDFFIRQRCILLDKYLKDLLSIPNIAEQHEVWDFLSATSKNYAFGKSTSVMKTLAYNMDDAMVDIFRQFKGVSSGLRHTIVGTSSAEKQDLVNASWKSKTANMKDSTWDRIYRSNYLLDEEEHAGEGGRVTHFMERTNGCLSDSELHEEHFASQSNTTLGVSSAASILEKTQQSQKTSEALLLDEYSTAESLTGSEMIEDEVGVPPEWTPPKLCVPLLNLVDKVFQLNQRGWLRRQIFWIGKQILHLVMEDAIDEWLLGQIQLLRREDVIASYIRQVHEVLLDKAIFTSEHSVQQQKENERTSSSSDGAVDGEVIQINTNPPELFQNQLEADRRANLVHDVILGAPAPLVSIIGRKQYNRCAEDLYFFLQSTVCLKQLAYSLLELLLITIFPELHDVVWHIRNNSVLL